MHPQSSPALAPEAAGAPAHGHLSGAPELAPRLPGFRGSFAWGLVRALRPRQWVKNVLVLAAPLAAGCPVIVKPGEQTSLSALRLGELVQDLFPAGVFNVITGNGATAGAALAGHPRVPRVAFTGSVATLTCASFFVWKSIIWRTSMR